MNITYTSVAVRSENEVYLAAQVDEYMETNPDHSIVFLYDGKSYKQLMVDHAVCSIVLDDAGTRRVCIVGPHGDVTTIENGVVSTSKIDAGDNGPSAMVLIRNACSIAGEVYAVGMARMAYLRRLDGTWQRIDSSVFVPRESRARAVGFHALAGRTTVGLVCVGQYGEIWRYAETQWTQINSPTNVSLSAVAMTPNGDLAVGGMSGVLLMGDAQHLRLVPNVNLFGDIWGVEFFSGCTYVSTYEGLFRISGDQTELVKFGSEANPSTAYLATGPSAICSVGAKHAYLSAEGRNWRELCPLGR